MYSQLCKCFNNVECVKQSCFLNLIPCISLCPGDILIFNAQGIQIFSCSVNELVSDRTGGIIQALSEAVPTKNRYIRAMKPLLVCKNGVDNTTKHVSLPNLPLSWDVCTSPIDAKEQKPHTQVKATSRILSVLASQTGRNLSMPVPIKLIRR